MTTDSVSTKSTATDKDFVITQIIDAKPATVFTAWTDPKHLKQWWGPHHFTNPICQVDLKVGGAYRFVMRSPEGGDYPMSGFYREIIEPKRLVFTINCDEHGSKWHELLNQNRPNRKGNIPEFPATITFEEQGGKTKLTIRKHFESVEDCNAMVKLGMPEGWAQSLERLEIEVAKM